MLDNARRPAAREPVAVRGPIGWAQAGITMVLAGDLLGALERFHRSLEDDGDCCVAWLGLSDVFRVMHDPRRSQRCLQVARQIHGRNTRGHVRIATTC